MKLRALLVSVAVLLLNACVTEVKGRQIPEADPEGAADSNLQLGVGYYRQGNLPAAQEKLERAIELDPKNVEAHSILGLVYERLDDPEEAGQMYKRAVQLGPEDPDALNYYAQFLCRRGGKRNEAMKLFDRAAEVPLSRKFVNKAVIYTNAGVCMKPVDLETAEAYLRKALQVDSRYREALLQMADVAHTGNNDLQARAFVERYLAVGRANPTVLWLGVQIESSLGDTRTAAKYAEQLKKDFPAAVQTKQLLEQERNAG